LILFQVTQTTNEARPWVNRKSLGFFSTREDADEFIKKTSPPPSNRRVPSSPRYPTLSSEQLRFVKTDDGRIRKLGALGIGEFGGAAREIEEKWRALNQNVTVAGPDYSKPREPAVLPSHPPYEEDPEFHASHVSNGPDEETKKHFEEVRKKADTHYKQLVSILADMKGVYAMRPLVVRFTHTSQSVELQEMMFQANLGYRIFLIQDAHDVQSFLLASRGSNKVAILSSSSSFYLPDYIHTLTLED
jgi:hypothetical protein